MNSWLLLLLLVASGVGSISGYITAPRQCLSIPSLGRAVSNQPKNIMFNSVSAAPVANKPVKNKLLLRWITGLTLGALGTLWIISGNSAFTFGFLVTSLIAQTEYYAILKAKGIIPASKIGTFSTIICYLAAAFIPKYHELMMPLSVTALMTWLLVFNKKIASISEISSSLLGMYYVGYLPSFWVRLRAIEVLPNTQIPAIFIQLNKEFPEIYSLGALITWITWTAIVVADVAAYFVGKNYGKNKLSTISLAAGSASPNKTVEGALGGFSFCMLFCILGAYLLDWPLFAISGGLYGLLISFVALVGDLTASMMKRDAGLKDTGNILPGHGGLLDRIDSYMLTAPACYFFITTVLPIINKVPIK